MSKDAGSQTQTQTSTSTATPQVPDFLQPLFDDASGFSQQGLGSLSELVDRGFTPAQIEGQQSGINVARGAGGFLPETQATLRDFLRGGFINDNVGTALEPIQDITQGGAVQADRGAVNNATNRLSSFARDPNADSGAINRLQQFSDTGFSPFEINPVSRDALEQSARGDFLFGNSGFDEAVQASIRAARPNILSTFAGQGGSGAAGGGLAQTAIQQASSDAFSRLFNQERGRQQGAASQLGQFDAQGRQLDLQGRGQQIGAAESFGDLGQRNRQLQTAAAQGLGQLGLGQQSQELAEQRLRAGTALDFGGILNAERGRQLDAAQLFPQAGLQESQILRTIGGEQQQNPIALQQALIEASLAGLPLNSLIGQTTNTTGTSSQPLTRNVGAGALGGALAGAKLGNIVPGLGTGIGAIGGGLLGAFF